MADDERELKPENNFSRASNREIREATFFCLFSRSQVKFEEMKFA